MWKKNESFTVEIEDMSEDGSGIGKTDGYIWFIKDAVIGDVVEAVVMKTKKSYGFARLIRVLEASPDRVKALCPSAKQCGGCQLQAVSYEKQLQYKENKIWNNLKRIGGFTNLVRVDENGDDLESGDEESGEAPIAFYPIIGMDKPIRYRNKAQFPFGVNKQGEIVAGFYAGRSHRIVEQQDCLLGVKENQGILDCIKLYMKEYGISPYDEETHRGLVRHVLIRKGFKTGELMVCLVINGEEGNLKGSEVLVKRLTELFAPGGDRVARADEQGGCASGSVMCSISCNINCDRTNVIMGSEIVNLYGPGYITDYIGNVKYRISPLSFYQVNPIQTEKLYQTALEYAGLTGGETVWDLYCGIGTISLFLAQKAGKVYGVEIVPQAIEDAKCNARINGIENVEFFVGRAEEVLPQQYEENHIYADVIVVDPPRKGCDEVCLDTIVKMNPERVVYVSCDSATLARDLRYLAERGYVIERVRGCDMFGMSVHVETAVLLVRKP